MSLRQVSIEVRKTIKHSALWVGLAALICLLALFVFVQHSRIKYGFVDRTQAAVYAWQEGIVRRGK